MPNAGGERGATRIARLLVAVLLTVGMACACARLPSAPDRHTTLFGTNVWQAPGESRADALDRVDATFGRIGVARVFSSWLPPVWPVLERDLGDRPLVVSFRLPPERVLSGAADARLDAWFRSAPRGQDTYWVYLHEPEDEAENGDFTPQQFRRAWSHVARLADAADNPRLHATLILMCWSAGEQSGRDWRSYVPDTGQVEVLAWDCYAKGTDATSYADTAALLEPAREASASVGADWAIGELGARISHGSDGTDRAQWLEDAGAYAIHHHARFVTYFDAPIGGSFRLTDPPSIEAWSQLVGS